MLCPSLPLLMALFHLRLLSLCILVLFVSCSLIMLLCCVFVIFVAKCILYALLHLWNVPVLSLFLCYVCAFHLIYMLWVFNLSSEWGSAVIIYILNYSYLSCPHPPPCIFLISSCSWCQFFYIPCWSHHLFTTFALFLFFVLFFSIFLPCSAISCVTFCNGLNEFLTLCH